MLFVCVLGLLTVSPIVAAQPPEKVKKPEGPRAPQLFPQEAVEQAREAVELAEAELELKRAHVAAAQVGVKAAERQFRLGQSAGAAVSEGERALLSFGQERAVAELRIKEAEMKIAEIKLQHARRKLARLEPAQKPREEK
jgi:hypothetical protein